ncbi:hypothetical protein SAMN04488554_1846 [Ruania alba]|uniref:Heme peroxidase n=1 Tax=Ruania alba TaxID=648782 RepID=A0A1H5H3Q9_9MICO|nr:hypothetical protein SAMN04488554_1846 [Ruania alba]
MKASPAQQVADAAHRRLPNRSEWVLPIGYPDSLALCIIDSIQSPSVHYGTVESVVRRYRDHRGETARSDGTRELLDTFDRLGGVQGWVATIGTRNLTSSRGGVLKAEVIETAALTLHKQSVTTTRELRAIGSEDLIDLKRQWLSLHGQRSGITWRYMLMLAGVAGVKPDRMILRFIRQETELGQLRTDEAAAVVTEAAKVLDVSPTRLDHAIWRYASGRSGPVADR